MNAPANDSLPEFHDSGIAAVRLLQGVLYSDDTAGWESLLRNQSDLSEYFARIGLVLVIDEADGLAYLRQLADDERTEGYEALPRLFRRTSLGYEATLLCVLLRDEFRRFEDEDLDNERCVVETEALIDAWKTFFPSVEDDVRLRKRFATAINKLANLKFVRKFHDDPETWEVRRILKARLPIDELENLKNQLIAAARG